MRRGSPPSTFAVFVLLAAITLSCSYELIIEPGHNNGRNRNYRNLDNGRSRIAFAGSQSDHMRGSDLRNRRLVAGGGDRNDLNSNPWQQAPNVRGKRSTTARYSFWAADVDVQTTRSISSPFPVARNDQRRPATVMSTAMPPTRSTTGAHKSRSPAIYKLDDRSEAARPSFNPHNGASMNTKVPVSLFFELKNITNPVEFLNRYVIEASSVKDTVVIDGQHYVKPGRNHSFGAPFAHAAGCTPQPTTMPIQMDAEPYVMYFPSCTRIERCDGCCNTELLECQPTKTEMARLQVLRVKYLGPNVNKFDISEPVVVELERHLQCDCLCRGELGGKCPLSIGNESKYRGGMMVKASDCRFYQVYRPNECRCECSNQHEAADCMGERFWDTNTCQCRCRHHHDCSTGFFFNDQTCLCEVMKTGRGGGAKPSFRGFD